MINIIRYFFSFHEGVPFLSISENDNLLENMSRNKSSLTHSLSHTPFLFFSLALFFFPLFSLSFSLFPLFFSFFSLSLFHTIKDLVTSNRPLSSVYHPTTLFFLSFIFHPPSTQPLLLSSPLLNLPTYLPPIHLITVPLSFLHSPISPTQRQRQRQQSTQNSLSIDLRRYPPSNRKPALQCTYYHRHRHRHHDDSSYRIVHSLALGTFVLRYLRV